MVDRESAQTWQGEKDAAEVVCWWRVESRKAATATVGGSGSVSFWGSVRHRCALAMPRPWGHLLAQDSTAATVLPKTLLRRSPGPAFGQGLGFSPFTAYFEKVHETQQGTAESQSSQSSCPGTSGHLQMCAGCGCRVRSSDEQRLWGWAAPFPFSLNRKGKQRRAKQTPQLYKEFLADKELERS